MNKSRRRRHGDARRGALAALLLGLATATANAACPPAVDDGATIANGDLLLAWRPLLQADAGLPPGRLPLARHFALEVQLCDRSGIAAAQLTKADATMPEHRHGMNYRPQIVALGGGRFRVEGLMFHMAGHWQLAFELRAGKDTARLTHDVQVD